jgi:hypothetical protein
MEQITAKRLVEYAAPHPALGRWADLVNHLRNDPAIRGHFQFWLFFYDTGDPIPFSGCQQDPL